MREEERYDIQGKLGEGGRGAVYLAKDRQLNRTVAIKRLISDEKNAEKDYEAVLHESRALSAINSPHIVRVFDVCQDEEGPYVVMEHLKGKTLHDVVSTAPLIEQDFLEIAEQALEALIAAHEAHLLHRDIKPGNLMLTWLPSGRFNLKLLDFGLAKFSATPAVQTIAHGESVMGSIYFMAPEQFDRKPLDQRTDLYSLGCVFFFALTGEYPFDGENVTEVMASHIRGRHKDLHAVRPDLPGALCEWVTHFISLDPDDRPESAQKALESLADAKRGTFTRVAPRPIAPQMLSGPVNVGPATGAVPRANLRTTAHQLAAPSTASVRVATRLPYPPPRSSTRSSSIPNWLLVLMGVASILVIVVGAALFHQSKQPDPPKPEPIPTSGKEPGKEKEPGKGNEPVKPAAKPALPPARSLPPSLKEELTQKFHAKDLDNDGKLTLKEWVSPKLPREAPDEARKFRDLDGNDNGNLTLKEFLAPANRPPKPKSD